MDINELINRDLAEGDVASEVEGDITSEGAVVQLVSFVLDEVVYGVDILAVHEILRFPEITRLPNAPDYIKGVVNLRGNIIPVVDVRARFGFPLVDITELTRIIVVETNEKLLGLMVDNVHQVVSIFQHNIDPPSELIDGVSEVFIQGIGKHKDRLIVILNLVNILFLEEEQV